MVRNARKWEDSSEAFGNRSEIVRILVLALTTTKDDTSGTNFLREVAARVQLFYKQNGDFWVSLFWFVKNKVNNQFKVPEFLTDLYVALQGRKKHPC